MAQKTRSQGMFEQQLRQLTEELTEMALVAEELFGAAARALVGRDRSLARQVAEGAGIGPMPDEFGETVQTRTMTLLQEWVNMADQVRRLMMVQQSAQELERVGDHARRIATHALALSDGVTTGLPSLGRMLGTNLLLLIRLVSQQLRGCAELLSAPDAARAEALEAGDTMLDQVYLDLVEELQARMAVDPDSALALTRLLFAAHEMECLGNRVGNICENIRYMVTYSSSAT